MVTVEYDQSELLEFLHVDFRPMNALCRRGGMFERLTHERTKAIFGYFDLSFGASGVE